MNPNVKSQLINLLERHDRRIYAIKRKAIREALGIPVSEDRQLRNIIKELRLEGYPILFATTAPAGYHMAYNRAELNAGIEKMRSYVIEECKIMRSWKQKGTQYLNGEKQGVLIS